MYDCEVLYQPVHLGGQSYIQVVIMIYNVHKNKVNSSKVETPFNTM